jgi:hypothetical protein
MQKLIGIASEHTKKYKDVKSKLQKEMCNSCWNYIENMIFDLDINEPDQNRFNKQPKNVYSYIKGIISFSCLLAF